uniref:Glutathione peroxidase n=1 Tax=Cyclopterus lumpus TaxID=8103 RepID=A0A8C2WCD6_CYCLU
MNELHERYAGKGLVILGVPCNQFGHQTVTEMMYIRPGNGFEPKFQLLEKVDVNGKNGHIPCLSALLDDPKLITWSPVCRNDVAWNFEKFLIGPDGRVRSSATARDNFTIVISQLPPMLSQFC